MKNIRKFRDITEYNLNKPNLPIPCVSLAKDEGKIKYNRPSTIAARYKITQETIDDYETGEIFLYGNERYTVSSYSLNGATYNFEEPEYEITEIPIELQLNRVEAWGGDLKFYFPTIDSVLRPGEFNTGCVWECDGEVSEEDYIFLCIFGWEDQPFNLIPSSILGAKEAFGLIFSEDLRSFSISNERCEKENGEEYSYYSYIFVNREAYESVQNGEATEMLIPTYHTTLKKATVINSDKTFNGSIKISAGQEELGKEYNLRVTLSKNADKIGKFRTYSEDWKKLISPVYNVDLRGIEREMSIPEDAFNDCKNLATAVLSDYITKIGDFAFDDCEKLTEINIPNNINTIEYSFSNCKSLKSIKISDSVTKIENRAFGDCSSLEEITFGKSLSYIDEEAFAGTSLKSITFNGKIYPTLIESSFSGIPETGTVYYQEGICNNNYNFIKDYFPSGWTFIEKPAEEINKVTAKFKITEEVINEFSENNELQLLNTYPGYLQSYKINDILYGPFEKPAYSDYIEQEIKFYQREDGYYVPKDAAATAINCSDFNEEIYLSFNQPIGLLSNYYLHYRTFLNGESDDSDSRRLDNAIEWGWVTYDEENNTIRFTKTFCERQHALNYEEGLNYSKLFWVSDSPYYSESYPEFITTQHIPTSISNEDKISPSVINVSIDDLSNNELTLELNYYKGGNRFGDFGKFISYLDLSNYGDGWFNIGENQFMDYTYLEEVVLGNNITYIENNAFRNCNKLKYINFPATLSRIGSYSFCGCSSLNSVDLRNCVRLESCGEYTFYLCSELSSILFSDSITYIGESALGYCRQLTTITFPEGIEDIGSCLFENCEKLREIIFPGKKPYIYNIEGLFSGVNEKGIMYYPWDARKKFKNFIDELPEGWIAKQY